MNIKFPLETFTHGISSVSLCLKRWWSISALNLWGNEIFYNDPILRENIDKNYRETFWMWPVAWNLHLELQHQFWWNLQQHGFLRNVERKLLSSEHWNIVTEYKHTTDSEFFMQYPIPFTVQQSIELLDNKAAISLNIINESDDVLHFAPGNHTYYAVDETDKEDILLAWDISLTQDEFDNWITWTTTVRKPNPWEFLVSFPWKKSVIITFDEIFGEVWFWSEKDKWFVCIEPVITHASDFQNNALSIWPWESQKIWFSIRI